MQAPNRLGLALNYFAEAYRFASKAGAAITPKRTVYGILDELADEQKYKRAETADVNGAMRLAICSAWVYCAIRLIGDRISSAEARPQVKKRIGERLEDIHDHPFERLMNQPNSLMTTDYILRYLTAWAHLSGNAYLFIATLAPGVGEPEEIYPLPSNMIMPLPATKRISKLTGKPCIDYQYTINNKKIILPGENVVHIRFANPFDYWRGLSPLTASIADIRVDANEQQYMESFFGRDNAMPSGVISLPAEIGDIDFQTAVEQIRDQFGKKHKTAIIRAGDMDIKTISQTLQQMEMVNTRKFNREAIYTVFGIPEGLITGGVSGDSRLSSEITFARNTVQPFLDMMCSELTANIAPYYGNDIVIAAPIIIPQDRSLKIQEYTTYSTDRTVNENRKELNLPPLDIPKKLVEKFDCEWLELMCEYVPVRLLPYVQSNTFAAVEPTEPNLEAPPEVGDSPGVMTGENFVEQNYARSLDARKLISDGKLALEAGDVVKAKEFRKQAELVLAVRPKPAELAGKKAELQRWRKVAVKEAKEGRDPSGRSFESNILTKDEVRVIADQIRGADELAVKHVFDLCVQLVAVVETA
jgi:HK97 family phage portal protein